jgi:lysylphosphatidylglycerol synthetase-like protein (DUF2156 family)
MAHTRPTVITILAILHIISGVLQLLVGLFFTFVGGLFTTGNDVTIEIIPSFTMAAMLGIVLGAVHLMVGYGLFSLKSWGWLMAWLFLVLSIVGSLFGLLQGENIPSSIISIVIFGLFLYYLNRPNVKRACHVWE